jgi:hypothetical protein
LEGEATGSRKNSAARIATTIEITSTAVLRLKVFGLAPWIVGSDGYTPSRENGLAVLVGLDKQD